MTLPFSLFPKPEGYMAGCAISSLHMRRALSVAMLHVPLSVLALYPTTSMLVQIIINSDTVGKAILMEHQDKIDKEQY